MRSKVYKTALAALISLTAFGAVQAQNVAPVPAVAPVANVPAVAPVAPVAQVSVYSVLQPSDNAQDEDLKKKSKTFSKSYPVDDNDAIDLSNSYGRITVNTWDKKEVKVDVEITAYANDDNATQKLLDQTDINSSKSGNVVSFKTDINKGGSNWWSALTNEIKGQTGKVVINYTVYMPAKSALNISNKYGAVILPDLDGKLVIKTAYGALDAKSLTNNGNVITMSYGGAKIGAVSGSQVSITYGSLDLGNADKLNATVRYTPVKIGKLNSSAVIDMRYGSLQIDDVSKNVKTLTVNSTYSPIKVGATGDIDSDFDVTTHYGEFSYNSAVNVTSKTPDKERGFSPTKSYRGHIGKGGSDKVIIIKSNYGSVKFD